jgi:citrate lyase subunit beta/citryl-CoA lyase
VAARGHGFAGKSCIHPSQVVIANDVFRPTVVEIARARKILAAAEDAELRGDGAFLVDGAMIDAPFLARARAIVALAEAVAPDRENVDVNR